MFLLSTSKSLYLFIDFYLMGVIFSLENLRSLMLSSLVELVVYFILFLESDNSKFIELSFLVISVCYFDIILFKFSWIYFLNLENYCQIIKYVFNFICCWYIVLFLYMLIILHNLRVTFKFYIDKIELLFIYFDPT